MTPAERLIAAADLLDKRAGEATEGPWSVSDPILDVGGEHGFDVDGPHGGYVLRLSDAHDSHYIATMHPEVGKALAAWLRTVGNLEARLTFISTNDQRVVAGALAVADLLLAGAS